MRKMAVYLGLVEDDHRYQDKYDSYGEYEDYEEQADRPEQIDEPDVRGPVRSTSATSPPTGAPSTCRRRPISPVLRHCILALTMKRVLLGNTSAKALR
jgi:hypothetical protein